MGIRFLEPLALLLLLPWIAFTLWSFRADLRVTGVRKRWAVSLRSLSLLLLIAALAGMQWVQPLQRQSVIYVVDRSDSIIETPDTEAWLRASALAKDGDDYVGVVSFGLDAAVDRNPSIEGLNQLELQSGVNDRFTDLSRGLQLAAGLLPEGTSPRVVLVSDGQENAGNLLRQARLLKNSGIPVDVLQVPPSAKKDAAIESVKLPVKLYQAEKAPLEIEVVSTFAGTGELRIYEDDREVSRQSVQMERGDNRYAVQILAKEPGFHRYRAEIYQEGDEQAANNMGYAFSRVSGPPRILIAEGVSGSSTNVEEALAAGLIGSRTLPPEMLPLELADYAQFDSIVLNNVPATRMSEHQMSLIEQAVKDFGVGLVMLGGEDSFGMGGYFKTAIERALPVSMELEGKREIPSLGLILVIDRSGSMDGGKLELAKEAAVRTVELMRPKDTIGVVAFDSTPWWVVEPQKLDDPKKVTDLIRSIQPAGGTEIYTAVEEGYQRMLKVEAQRKHLILLTDGQSATTRSYEELAEKMAEGQMTLSTVAIGDADTGLLERLAKMAKGRYYYTNDQSTLPAIFSREAVMMARTYIVDQPFVPSVGQAGDWASMLREGTPQIKAYVAATPKPTAEVALASPEQDPLLARWQYGSGRAVAWTSDVTGKWSADWVNWASFPEVFSRIIKWTFPQFEAFPFEMDAQLNGDRMSLALKSMKTDIQGEVSIKITAEGQPAEVLKASPTVPGEYRADLQVKEPGVYLAQVQVTEGDKSGSYSSGFVIPYSPEFRVSDQGGEGKLKEVAELTGGRLLSWDKPEEVFGAEIPPKKQPHDLTRFLLITVLLLWLADIGVRRLNLTLRRRIIMGSFFLQKLKERETVQAAEMAAAASVNRLRQHKRSTKVIRTEQLSMQGRPLQRDTQNEAGNPSDDASSRGIQADSSPSNAAENEGLNRLLAAKNRRRR
ncbi:Mg-chelatase subunit ChlD [Paenibacillus mucilaginosus]|uniref:VWA domain-containing protein n=1 Tax=Paenibacillus mucilaginosus TaxID=61624 RepID=UPI003D1F8F82